MDKALEKALSKPEILKRYPNIVETVVNAPEYKIIQRLLHNSSECTVGVDPLPGVTLNFDKVDIKKNYSTADYSHLNMDMQIPDNIPISQILHNTNYSRILIPYYKNSDISPEKFELHVQRLKQSVIAICQVNGNPITEQNISITTDVRGHFVLQITNKYVDNLENNKKFTERVQDYIKDTYNDTELCVAIDGGYRIFKYNEYHQKYPLLADKSEQNYGVLQKLIHDPQMQPITININVGNTTINNIGNHNTQLIDQSQTIQNSNLTIGYEEAIIEFIKLIKTQKPTWYQEQSWMPMCTLQEKFNVLFPNHKMYDKHFNKLIKYKIGNKYTRRRINGVNRIASLLKPFKDL